jgi:hypothetical protein
MSDLMLPLLAVSVVTGLVAARLAKNRGRDPVYGFAAGFFLSIIGLAIMMTIKQKKNVTDG